MSISSYLTANVDVVTDSFGGWINKTNLVIHDMGTVVVTVADVAQPNTTNGAQTTGNSHIEGRFSANTLIAATALRGGTVSTPANLVVTTNTIFNESALVKISSNTNLFDIDANNVVLSSNVTFDGGSTKRILIDVANTTVNTGSFFVRSNTEFTGTSANVGTATFSVTANSTFSGANVYITSTNTTIGDAGTDGLNVNARADFNANVNIDGVLTTINSTNTTIGDAGTDKMNIIAESIFSANATFNGGLVNITSTNTTIGDAGTDVLNVNAVSDFNANVNIDGILTQTANAVFSGVLVNITSTNTTIGDAATDILNVNAVSAFAANVSIAGITSIANSATVSGTLTVNTQANTASLMVRDLTATRVPYVGAAGEIVDSANLSFSGTDLNVIGTANITSSANVGGIFGVTGAATFANTIAVTGTATFSNNAVFGDNKYIIMGDTQDLIIYHDGSHSYITDQGTGNLKLDASQLDIQTSNSTATETMATFVRDGAVTLYYDNAIRFATTSTGASITGTLGVSGVSTLAALSATTGTFSSTLGISGTTTAAAINASGIVSVTNTTDATSNTAAAIKTAGGLAVAKKLYVGGESFLQGNVAISSGKYLTTPYANVTTDLVVGGNTSVNNLTVTGTTTLSSDITLTVNTATFTSALVTSNLALDIASTITGRLIPTSNNTQDIGSTTNIWKTLYANNIVANVAWASVTDKPDPVITVSLDGDVSGSGSVTLTDLGSATLTISNMLVKPDSVALGTDTTGNYVGTLAAGTPSTQSGTSGLTISAAAGEGTAVTIAHADTSSVSNLAVNNSSGTVLQDLSFGFDTFGHVTSVSSASINLDLRYPQSAFTNIAVAGQSTVVSDSLTDTLTLVGDGITTIITNATTDTITIKTTEADTLASVTERGNSTTTEISVANVSATNVTISGNLTVSGTTTYVNTTQLNIGDNIITLNADYTGSSPTENAGIEIERGTLSNVSVLWNETSNRWSFTNDGTTYYNLPLSSEYDNYTSWTIRDGDTTTYTITSGDTLQIIGGDYITSNFTADDVLRISHNSTTRINTTTTGAPGYNGSFTTLDSITTNDQGHVTGVNTKTVTLPAGTNLSATAGTTAGPTIVSSTGTNVVIPSASETASGVVTTGTQYFAGAKIFNSTITGSLSGNATTATRLAANTTINGANFNGSQTIRINELQTSTGALIIDGTAQSVPVNYLQVRAANTGQDILVTTAGSDTNIDLLIQTKGTGSITLDTGTGAGVIDLKPGASNVRIWDDTSTHFAQIITNDLTSNTSLTLANGNTTLVAGTMVPTTGTGATGTWNITATNLNGLTASITELNKLDGATVSTTELNRLVGVTDNVQTQLNAKAPLASPTFTGTVTSPRLRLTPAVDASLTSTTHNFQIGDTSSINLVMDNNEIMVRNNDAASTLILNGDGGDITLGGGTTTTATISLRATDVAVSGDLDVTGTISGTTAAIPKGFIVFNGATGAVIRSKNLTLTRVGVGNYTITCSSAIRDGTSNWGVVITNVDEGTLTQTPSSIDDPTINSYQADLWNAFVSSVTTTGFTVRANRTYSRWYSFLVGNDNGGGNAFGITSIDPTRISLIVF